MKTVNESRQFRRLVVHTITGVLSVVLTVALLYGLKPLLLPFVLGAFLAYLFQPIVRGFRGSALSKTLRALMLIFSVSTFFYYAAHAVKASLPERKEKLELKVRLQYRLNEKYTIWMGLDKDPKGNFIYQRAGNELDEIKKKIIDFTILSDVERRQFIQDRLGEDGKVNETDRYYQYHLANLKARKVDIAKLKANPSESATSGPGAGGSSAAIAEGEGTHEGSILAAISHTFFIWLVLPLTFIFLLLDRGQVIHFFLGLVPNRYFELAYTVLDHVDVALGKYIRGTMLECLLVGLSLFVGLYVCGFDLKVALLIGLIGGITNAVPLAGPLIACVFGVAYALIAENLNPLLPFVNENNLVLAVLAVVFITRILDDAVFQPLVVGSAVNLHPLVVIAGVFGGSIMFGAIGLVFAIPTIVVLKVMLETFFSGLKDYRII